MSTRTAEFYSQPQIFSTKHLNLSYSFVKGSIEMTLRLEATHISTKTFPRTYEILQKLVPSVLSSQCFNDLNLPFQEEVKSTEMGHLLEHILLEYLCLEKMDYGSEEADFSGETSWNWIRDPHGTFQITIDCSQNDYIFFLPALEKSIGVLEEILFSKLHETKTHHFFQPTYPSTPTMFS